MNGHGTTASLFSQIGNRDDDARFLGSHADQSTGQQMDHLAEPVTMGNPMTRPRSTSNVSTSFPSSHDAFGLSASPSATSNMARSNTSGIAGGTRQPSPWSQSGSQGYGLYGPGNTATMMLDTSGNSPSGNHFAHGILPTSTLLGDPQFRMNRPSGLSQAWAGDDMESEEVASGVSGPHHGTADSANSDVEQWRNALEPPSHIRRSQSSFASIPDPKSPHMENQGGYNIGHSAPSSSSRFSMALRRVSSEHSAVRDSSEIHRMPGPDGFSSKGFSSEHVGHGDQDGPDNNGRTARTPPPKSCNYAFGTKPLSDRRNRVDYLGTPVAGAEARGTHAGYNVSGRRRSSIMDTTQPKLLPPNLRKTLAAEANLPMQEIRSEALLQRLILSNAESLPVTPRPSRRGRLLNSFLEAESDDSDHEQEDDDSSNDGPFAVDDLIGGDEMATGGMDVEMSGQHSSPFAFAPNGGNATFRPGGRSNRGIPSRGAYGSLSAGMEGFGLCGDDRHDSRASQGSARGSDASGSGMDVAGGQKSNATAWRESPAAGGRTNKRKAAFDDARFEPYNKRHRPGDQSPSHWTGTLPPGPIPMSPTGHHANSDPMDFTPHATSRAINFARSRGGSPAAASQMQAMRTVSPVTSSPLASMAAAGNGGPIGMPPGMAMGYRPTIGMGGLGMLLMSKRSGQGVGTGLMNTDGETAVAEGIGGMDVRSGTRDEDGEDEMVFD